MKQNDIIVGEQYTATIGPSYEGKVSFPVDHSTGRNSEKALAQLDGGRRYVTVIQKGVEGDSGRKDSVWVRISDNDYKLVKASDKKWGNKTPQEQIVLARHIGTARSEIEANIAAKKKAKQERADKERAKNLAEVGNIDIEALGSVIREARSLTAKSVKPVLEALESVEAECARIRERLLEDVEKVGYDAEDGEYARFGYGGYRPKDGSDDYPHLSGTFNDFGPFLHQEVRKLDEVANKYEANRKSLKALSIPVTKEND